MPIIKSAKKRVKVSAKAAVRNSKTKRTLKSALKSFHSAVTGRSKTATSSHSKAQSALDTAAKKGLLHKNKVARAKKQLAAKAKTAASSAKTAPAQAVKAAKPAKVTKPVAKKATAVKKTVAKKAAPAKKPVAKKKTSK